MELRDINDIGNLRVCELADAINGLGILTVGAGTVEGSTVIHFERETFLEMKQRFKLDTKMEYAGLTERPYWKEICMLPGRIKLMSILDDEDRQGQVPPQEGQVA